MPGFETTLLTDVGWDALTDAEAGQHIQYTHLEAGDGHVYGGDVEIFGMTALKNKVMDFPITNFSNDGRGQITLIGVISSKNVTAGFQFREIGVRCTIDGGPSILYAVSNSGDLADYIPSSAETEVVIQTVQIIIRIDRAENVTVIIQPGLDVTCQNIGPGTDGAGWFRDKIGQVCWFKRIKSPKATLDVVETSDLITLDIPTIDVDLDLYVAIGNPDIFPHFSTIQKALDYLIPFHIKEGKYATINVMPGYWVASPTIKVSHPQGGQVRIIGTAGPVKNVSNVTNLGSNYVRLNAAVGTFNDMVAGDYFFYHNYGHSSAMCITGCWRVDSKAANGSSITYYNATYTGLPNLAVFTGGTVTPIKSVISIVRNVHGMTISEPGIGTLANLVFVNEGGTITTREVYCIYNLSGVSNLTKIGVHAWQGQYAFIGGGVLSMSFCYATWSWNHSFASGIGGTIYCSNCAATAGGYGFFSMGQALLSSCSACVCATAGYSGTNLSIDNCYARNNAHYGIYAIYNSRIGAGPNWAGQFFGNIDYDLALVYGSIIYRAGPATAIYYEKANVAPYTISSDGSYLVP